MSINSNYSDSAYRNMTGHDLWADLNDDLEELNLPQRSSIVELDRELHRHWGLGRNFILGWCTKGQGVEILLVPHYVLAEYALATRHGPSQEESKVNRHQAANFVMSLLARSRLLNQRQMDNAGHLLGVEPVFIRLRQPLSGIDAETRIVEILVTRYGVSYVQSRAVALFDIVGFSLLSPFEQMTQLNSLSYSLNSAHNKLLDRKLNVNFARSSTGDGFYIWNRDLGVSANTNLYHLMHLVLADNAIARSKANGRTVPLLRAAFHVGSCYEFYQAEGLNPTIFSDIVGDVTIELARMIEQALPGQVLLGDFETALKSDENSSTVYLDAISFVEFAQANLSRLNGMEMSGDVIESIKCYLTGEPYRDGFFSVRKLTLQDKHGMSHNVFNAKINIHRKHAEPIFLGIEDRIFSGNDELLMKTTDHIMPKAEH
jgi:hypothetical protein